MKQLILILSILLFISCAKDKTDMDNNLIIGTWNDCNMTFIFQKDSFKTCNQFGLYNGMYYIRENTIICKTQYNTYLYVQLQNSDSFNNKLFIYWFDYANKKEDLLKKIK